MSMSSIRIDGDSIEVSDRIRGDFHFSGLFRRSSNGRFIVAWDDSCQVGEAWLTGYRKKGHGTYLLMDGNEVLLVSRQLERPVLGRVSNEGTYILNDEGFGDAKWAIYAFKLNDRQILRYQYRANDAAIGISDDGHYAALQMEHIDGDTPCNALLLFDLVQGRLASRFAVRTGQARDVSIDTDQVTICLSYDDGRNYRYTFEGRLLDEEGWYRDRVDLASRSAYGYELLSIAEEKRQQLDSIKAEPQSYDVVLDLLNRGLEKGVSEYTQAGVHRTIGAIHHKLGNKDEAIKHLETALSLNPKIGAKRLLDKLRREP